MCVCMWLGVPCITVIRDTIQDVTRVRKQVTAFDAKQFTNYTDREKVVHLTRNVGEELGLLRAQMRDVLVQCLDEMDAHRLGMFFGGCPCVVVVVWCGVVCVCATSDRA